VKLRGALTLPDNQTRSDGWKTHFPRTASTSPTIVAESRKRNPAPKNGGTPTSPTLMASHVRAPDQAKEREENDDHRPIIASPE
jgi:hypothetical protein